MNYSINPAKVRVDFFKSSGKWYDTIEIDMGKYYNDDVIHDAVFYSTRNETSSYEGMTLVCLQPYHKNAYPIMILDWTNYLNRQGAAT